MNEGSAARAAPPGTFPRTDERQNHPKWKNRPIGASTSTRRVVQGQRLMQPASDLFLGWVIGPEGRHFYIRQLRDVKLSPLVETYDAEMLSIYGQACGWVLARAHAKAGDPWAISGYLGKNAQFDEAMGKFALAYADQAERDHAALKTAVRAGIVEVRLEH
jgi:hypothetical protein